MTWSGMAWLGVMVTVNVVVQVGARRFTRRRSLRDGRVVVSARSTTTTPGRSDARWRLCRVTRESGRLVLRRATDHVSEPGVELYAPVSGGRPLQRGERVRLVTGAARVVPVATSAGLIELAGPREVLDWLTAQLAVDDPARTDDDPPR